MNKIENKSLVISSETMKPIYSTNKELLCGVINYNDKIYLLDLDDTNKYVKQITFDINRNRLYTHTLTFSNTVTQKIAVLEVEKWLSEKLTEEYFNIIVKDKFKINTDNFDMYKDSIKGTLLSSCIFLEEITNITESHIFISCGS
jgi:hypothetical protein